MKRLAVCLVIIVSLVWAGSVFAEDIEKQELRLQLLQTEVAALQTAIQRDNAQIALLQERMMRVKKEIEDRLEQVDKLKAEIQQLKDKEVKPKKP